MLGILKVITRLTDPSSNEVATSDTVHDMVHRVREQVNSPIVKQIVAELQLPSLTTVEQCISVFKYVKGRVRYVEDSEILKEQGYHEHTFGSELLQDPDYLLSQADPKGDCDCISLLVATLLMSAGTPNVYFTTIKDVPDMWTHIYVTVGLDANHRVNVDCSHGPYCGWELPNKFVFERRYWKI